MLMYLRRQKNHRTGILVHRNLEHGKDWWLVNFAKFKANPAHRIPIMLYYLKVLRSAFHWLSVQWYVLFASKNIGKFNFLFSFFNFNFVQSDDNEYVPLLVARCTHIVETKGLSIVGIYRIPGNTAAISALTDQVNRGFDDQTLNDPKWDDVNVVSSLLKLFIRSLPDALLPNDMYGHFIEVDKETGQERLVH